MANAAPDVLGETLGSLLGELAWDETDKNGQRARRASAAPQAMRVERTAAPTEGWTSREVAMKPWAFVVDALAGRKREVAVAAPRAIARETAVESRVEAKPMHPAMAPWSQVLARLAGRGPVGAPAAAGARPSSAKDEGPIPNRWRSVADKSPGETVEDFLGSVDWT